MKINYLIIINYFLSFWMVTIGILSGFLGTSTSAYRISFIFLIFMYIAYIADNRYLKKNRFIFIFFAVIMILALFIRYDFRVVPLEIIAYIGCLVLYQISINYKLKQKELNILCYSIAIASAVFIYAYNINNTNWHGVCESILDFNPQHVGGWAFLFFASSLVMYDYIESKSLKVFFLFIMTYMTYINVKTDTRTGLVVIVFIILLRLFPMKNLLKNKFFIFFFSGLPCFATGILLYIYKSIGISITNGREYIWSVNLSSMTQPLLGDYMKYRNVYAHNIFVEHVLYYGYIFAILFILLTFYALFYHISNIDNQINYDGYICFLGCLLFACQENAIFSTVCGGMFIYAMSFLFIMAYAGMSKPTSNIFQKHPHKEKKNAIDISTRKEK